MSARAKTVSIIIICIASLAGIFSGSNFIPLAHAPFSVSSKAMVTAISTNWWGEWTWQSRTFFANNTYWMFWRTHFGSGCAAAGTLCGFYGYSQTGQTWGGGIGIPGPGITSITCGMDFPNSVGSNVDWSVTTNGTYVFIACDTGSQTNACCTGTGALWFVEGKLNGYPTPGIVFQPAQQVLAGQGSSSIWYDNEIIKVNSKRVFISYTIDNQTSVNESSPYVIVSNNHDGTSWGSTLLLNGLFGHSACCGQIGYGWEVHLATFADNKVLVLYSIFPGDITHKGGILPLQRIYTEGSGWSAEQATGITDGMDGMDVTDNNNPNGSGNMMWMEGPNSGNGLMNCSTGCTPTQKNWPSLCGWQACLRSSWTYTESTNTWGNRQIVVNGVVWDEHIQIFWEYLTGTLYIIADDISCITHNNPGYVYLGSQNPNTGAWTFPGTQIMVQSSMAGNGQGGAPNTQGTNNNCPSFTQGDCGCFMSMWTTYSTGIQQSTLGFAWTENTSPNFNLEYATITFTPQGAASSFSLTASPSSLSMFQGTSASTTISVSSTAATLSPSFISASASPEAISTSPVTATISVTSGDTIMIVSMDSSSGGNQTQVNTPTDNQGNTYVLRANSPRTYAASFSQVAIYSTVAANTGSVTISQSANFVTTFPVRLEFSAQDWQNIGGFGVNGTRNYNQQITTNPGVTLNGTRTTSVVVAGIVVRQAASVTDAQTAITDLTTSSASPCPCDYHSSRKVAGTPNTSINYTLSGNNVYMISALELLATGIGVTLACTSGIPPRIAGVSCSLNPQSGVTNFSSNMTITASASASIGTFILVVSGFSGGQIATTNVIVMIKSTFLEPGSPSTIFKDTFLYSNTYLTNLWTVDRYGTTDATPQTIGGNLWFSSATSVNNQVVHVTSTAFNPSGFTNGTIIKRKLTIGMIPFASIGVNGAAVKLGMSPFLTSGTFPGTTPFATPYIGTGGSCSTDGNTTDKIGAVYVYVNNTGKAPTAITCGNGSSNVAGLGPAINPTLFTVFTIETRGLICTTCQNDVYANTSWVYFRIYQENSNGAIITSSDVNLNFTSNIAPMFQATHIFIDQFNPSGSGAITRIALVDLQNFGSPVLLPPPPSNIPFPTCLFCNIQGLILLGSTYIGLGNPQLGAFVLWGVVMFVSLMFVAVYTKAVIPTSMVGMCLTLLFIFGGFLPTVLAFLMLFGSGAMLALVFYRLVTGAVGRGGNP